MNDHTPHTFTLKPSGPFDLGNQNRYFGGWPTLPCDPGAIVMAFPVEESDSSAAVVLRQRGRGVIEGEVHRCPQALAGRAMRQALAAVSLDLDGSGWGQVGERDPVIGRLQAKYRHLRPSLFHSPYEAAAAFVIGHRISVKQTRALRAQLTAEHGAAIHVEGERFCAFPTPSRLLAISWLAGINASKTERLRAIARAANEGWLTREHLRATPGDAALARLKTLPGIGEFFAQAILHRGAGAADSLPDDQVTRSAVTRAYGLKTLADREALDTIAERWRPYRLWTAVLLHVWARSELKLPPRHDRQRPRGSGRSDMNASHNGREHDRPRSGSADRAAGTRAT